VVRVPALRDLGVVSLAIPADPNYVHILRGVAASVAARLPMSLDDVDDLRLAVDEAAARLLQLPRARRLTIEIAASTDALEVTIETDGDAERWPGPDVKATLPWKILAALGDHVAFERREGTAMIRFRKRVTSFEVRV
jgi:serine/threonine-protein kinase RsbW